MGSTRCAGVPVLRSQVVIGAIVAAVAVLLGLFGFDVTETQQELLSEGAIALFVIFGGGLSIYGRATTAGARRLRVRKRRRARRDTERIEPEADR